MVRRSVLVNGIAMPFRDALRAIRRFCQPAMFLCGDPVLDAGASGSSVFLRYRGHNFGLCTSHQFDTPVGRLPSDSFFLGITEAGNDRIGIRPATAIRVRFGDPKHENLQDIFVAQFRDEQEGRQLRHHFLEVNLLATLNTVPADRIFGIVSIGFPTQASETEILYDEEENMIGSSSVLRYVIVYFERTAPVKIDHPNRLPLVLHPKNEDILPNADGMSGAPVFLLYLDDSAQAHLGFAGIITNSNNYRFLLYEADTIRTLLDNVIDEPSGNLSGS